MLKELKVYVFDVKLHFLNDEKDYITFKVVGDRSINGWSKAKKKLMEYLETDGHTDSGYLYKEVVGIREKPSDSVLIDPSDFIIEERRPVK